MTAERKKLEDSIDILRDAWTDYGLSEVLHQPASRRGKKIQTKDFAKMQCIEGLTRHVYDNAEAVQLLIEHGSHNSAIPIARLSFESAITSAWLAQTSDNNGVVAFVNDYYRQRRAAKRQLVESNIAKLRELAEATDVASQEELPSTPDSTRNFENLCRDFVQGSDLYSSYRLMSSHSHASLQLVDNYWFDRTDEHGIPHRRPKAASGINTDTLLITLVMSMVWSGRAYTYISDSTEHRSVLRKVAREFGIKAELKLSSDYHLRQAKYRTKQGEQ